MDNNVIWQLLVSFIGIAMQVAIAFFSQRLVAKQGKETLDVQRLVSHRATASFIAEKRQRWIDELRVDISFYLALSQEIIWKYDAGREKSRLFKNENPKATQIEIDDNNQRIADSLSHEIGLRDRTHQESYIKLKLRLNSKEDQHIELRNLLDNTRQIIQQTQAASDLLTTKKLIIQMKDTINQIIDLTEQVLKKEWTRVKQEVAFPDLLIQSIPKH